MSYLSLQLYYNKNNYNIANNNTNNNNIHFNSNNYNNVNNNILIKPDFKFENNENKNCNCRKSNKVNSQKQGNFLIKNFVYQVRV